MIKQLFLLSICLLLPVAVSANIIISRVEVSCGDSNSCMSHKRRLKALSGNYRNVTHLRQTLKIFASVGGVKDFNWSLGSEEACRRLAISFHPKVPIGKVKISARHSSIKDYIERNTKIRVGDWFDESVFVDENISLLKYLNSKGYPKAVIKFSSSEINEERLVLIDVEEGEPQLLSSIIVKTESDAVRRFANQKFLEVIGKNFDIQNLRQRADELEAELFGYGYYLATVNLTPKKVDNTVIVQALIGPVEKWVFDVRHPLPPVPARDIKIEFANLIRDLFKRYKRPIDEGAIKVAVAEYYKTHGYLRTDIRLSQKRYRDKFHDWINHISLEIIPGNQTYLRNVSFRGTTFWDSKKMLKMWRDQSFELAAAGFYDEASNINFSQWLKGEYIKNGFVRAEIPPPKVTFFDDGGSCNVEYTVSEGQRVYVDEIKISGASEDEVQEVLELLDTKQSMPFNPVRFNEDLKKISDFFQSRGFYNADVTNKDSDEIVVYGQDKSSAKIHIRINKGRQITFNRLVIVGNRYTKNNVIRRKSPFSPGGYITPGDVKDYENALSSTGLFVNARVRPLFHKGDTSLTDVVVEVMERDYGLIEVAPGYRTDIGLKLSGTVSYMNIFGENVSTSLTGQINQRLDLQALDERRRDEGKSLLEYNLSSQTTVPDLEESSVDYGLGISVQRRRFFSFDADISRLSNTLSRDFGPRYSVSLRHQYESINQFDATESRDNGSFKIGALTPSITADFRNTRINPTAGAWFNISNEFANPFFFSQKNEDLTINFYKLVSRNRFYIPFPNGTVAISLVGGLQENLSKDVRRDSSGNPVLDPETGDPLTEGYIPNIKVFRLTGLDIVRGFSDEEINRLPDGKDIGDDPVQNKAYMANFKLEPRYFINDSLMAGVFFDAGRVYVDSVDLSQLRQSVGVTFKVVTPVGTLDFDYGIKLLRKKDQDGNLEAPGRFHVSIGFF